MRGGLALRSLLFIGEDPFARLWSSLLDRRDDDGSRPIDYRFGPGFAGWQRGVRRAAEPLRPDSGLQYIPWPSFPDGETNVSDPKPPLNENATRELAAFASALRFEDI